MKYGIWRHESALGNSAEQTVCLADFIDKNKDENPVIYVEHEFQKDFALCIRNVKPENIIFYKNISGFEKDMYLPHNVSILPKDIFMPDLYFENMPNYPSAWKDIKRLLLQFPYDIYSNNLNLPENCILMSIRESGTYDKRVDGSMWEPERFVNPEIFFNTALHFAEKGFKVVRIGDPNQTPMPKHKNITDLAITKNKTMLDDFFLISKCKVFLSCDSGVWPMAGGMKKPLILSNVCSPFRSHPPKLEIVNWLNQGNTKVIFKNRSLKDNTKEELVSAINEFL